MAKKEENKNNELNKKKTEKTNNKNTTCNTKSKKVEYKESKKEIKPEKNEFGDIIKNHDLIKRTLMVAGFPALIKKTKTEKGEFYEGFLPGFEFANINEIENENECVEYLQDMLDDEVEELVVFGKSLPFVEDDDILLKKNPSYKIVYLDINVYATKDELDYFDCHHDCDCCSHDCNCDDDDCDCDDDYECDCCDENCGHDDCDDCDCCDDENCDCCCDHDDDCDCGCHDDCDDHRYKHDNHCDCNHHNDKRKK